MDDRARAILDEARETLERTAHIRVERRNHFGDQWERPKPEPAPEPRLHQPSVAEVEAMRAADWTRFLDSRISAALAKHDDLWRDIIGSLVSEVRKQLRAEITAEVGSLRADVTIEKAAERRDGVVDLPMLPLRSRHA